MNGTVSDSTEARVTSASVFLQCGASMYQARTDGAGRFVIQVPPGDFLLRVEAAGFTACQKVLHFGTESPSVDVTLTVQNAGSTVTVQTEAGYVASDGDSAMKTNTPLLETPQSISVVTRDQLDAQQPQSLNEALRYSPGVVAESQGATSTFWGAGSLLLRGFAPEVYLNGLQDDANGNNALDSYFYQRLEILAGPSSVLYGQANPGGIVNVESKRPMASTLRELQIGFGSFGRYQGMFDFSGPFKSPHLLYRVTGVGFTEGTQTWFIDAKRLAIAPALSWIPNDKTNLALLSNYTYNPSVGAYAYVPALGTALPNPNGKIAFGFFSGDPNFNQTKQSFLQLGDAFIRAFDHDWRIEQDFRYTTSKNNANMIWPLNFESDNATLDRYSFIRRTTFDSILSDNRVVKQLRTGTFRHTLLVGVNYRHYRDHWNWGSVNEPPINVFHPVYYQTISVPEISGIEFTTSQQAGIYFQDQIAVGRLRASFGGRQDWLTYNDVTNGSTTNQNDNKFTWRTGVSYLLPHGFAPYFSYAKSFQPDLGITAAGTALPPTTGSQYEGGLKYQPDRTNLLVTAAVYDLAQQNVGTTDPTNPNFSIPVGEIRSRGAEFQAHTSLARHLNAIATYAYTSSKYSKSNITGIGIDGITSSTQGKYQYSVPLNTASFWLDYTLPFALLRGTGLSGGSRFVGASWGDNVNSFKVPGATLFDAALHYDFNSDQPVLHGVQLQVNATNLGDRTYIASCFSTSGCYFGMKRTVYGTVRYRW
ncbi:TonB-dependent siderophore receptor [Granulicella arctica]|uniref:Iron complex outermembrane receptor protein n=1 Tax=Granulicella arctica TaxID=940613 RepID=A0A7Y9PDJ2_9BACT|nr:TonB-dependent siderophore receptor [Granulicella arctica]NYF77945.1 iron complex outermembrane receptor protein [Granulicella arctica]